MVGVRVRQEEGVKGLGWNRQDFDVVRERITFALEYAAIDCEALTAGGMEDEVGGTGDRTAGPERLIEERRGRERVVCRQTQLRGAGERTDVCDAEVLGGAHLCDRLGRIEQIGERLEVRHRDVHGGFWADSSR